MSSLLQHSNIEQGDVCTNSLVCFSLYRPPALFPLQKLLNNLGCPRFVRRGRASHRKRDLDDEVPSDWEEIASDVENKEELREWLTTQNCKSILLPHKQLVRKYLAPGTVMDLYEHYKSTQAMLGCHSVSFLGSMLALLLRIIYYT